MVAALPLVASLVAFLPHPFPLVSYSITHPNSLSQSVSERLPSGPSLDRVSLLAGIVTKSPGVVTGLDRLSLLAGAKRCSTPTFY
nr:hypothetical protein Q903MT_gene748 [Picea sitchensis]